MLGRLLGGLVIVAASAEGGAAVQENSTSPWDRYNVGIEAYAAGEFVRAEAAWQDLALESLPRTLRRPVWFQLGNARFRLGEGLEPTAPEEAVELWRRSLESYRQALSLKPRDAAVRHNLGLVERRLATRLHALGLEAFNSAANKARDEAITLLRTAVTDLDEAALLAPGDSVIREDRDRARDTLRERLLDRAEQAERRGDEEARQQASWADRQAAERYHEALEDIRESSSATTVPRAEQARERVTRKLADLLARMGQREQRAGQSLAQANPDEALDRFETALAHFQEAQSTQPGHAAAERGEREVRQAMQRLHVQEGQDALRQGREQLERGNPQAAPSLTTALGHFEAALSLNPNNVPAQKGADEARQLLPDALALAGENAMRAGDRAETADPGEALNQYQEAESNFQQALDQEPDHTRASQGLEALEPRLARMRQRLEQEGQQASASNRRTPSLDSLLDQVSEREPTPFEDRQRQPARNRPGERRQPRDW